MINIKYSSLTFIFIFSLLIAGTAFADTFSGSFDKKSTGDTRLVINVASKHVGADGLRFNGEFSKFNEANWGVGIEQDISPEGTVTGMVGIFTDSFSATAFYAGVTVKKWLHEYFAVGLTGGVVSSKGYSERGYATFGIVPTFGPMLVVTNGTFGVNLSVMPVGFVSEEVDAIYTLQFTMKIK